MNTLQRIINHPANQGQVPRAITRYLLWQLSKRTLVEHWDIPYHGLILRCHRHSHSASAALYFNGLPDFREMSFIKRYLRPGDIFLDVGANVGVYSLLAAALVGRSGAVHAFEPGTLALMQLRENIKLNRLDNVTVHELALSDHDGKALFSIPSDDCVASLVAATETTAASTSVDCVSLDVYLPSVHFAMAKLDIEGAEPLVIRGARAHLQAGNPPVLQIEMDGYCRKFGIQTEDFINELNDLGYDVGIYDVAKNAIELTSTPWRHGVLNVLAVNRARSQEVHARLGAAVTA